MGNKVLDSNPRAAYALLSLAALLLLIPASSSGASANSRNGKFFFLGTSSSSGDVAFGAGKVGPSSSHPVRGVGLVSTRDGRSVATFSLTGFVFCSGGPPPGIPCLGLKGAVTSVLGGSINGAKVGDPVVVILVEKTDHSGSTCIIIPAPGFGGTCDNFVGTVAIP